MVFGGAQSKSKWAFIWECTLIVCQSALCWVMVFLIQALRASTFRGTCGQLVVRREAESKEEDEEEEEDEDEDKES